MAHAALQQLKQNHEQVLVGLRHLRHLQIYALVELDTNISYLLQQLHILQEYGTEHRVDIHLILLELAKLADTRDAVLKTNTDSFPELSDARAYAKKNTKYSPDFCTHFATGCAKSHACPRFHGTREEHLNHLKTHRFTVKIRMCKNVLCRYGASCPRFHGTYPEHLIYLHRCNYKMLPAPVVHRCYPTDCVYYHSNVEKTHWDNRYRSIQHNQV